MATIEEKRMLQLYGSSTLWTGAATVPLLGEVCIERVDSNDFRIKIGDGTRLFGDLPYANASITLAGIVSTFNTHPPVDGNIAPQEGDYTADMITESAGRVWFASAERTKLASLIVSAQTPAGGAIGQVLTKASATAYDFSWITPTVGSGGSSDIAKTWGSDYGLAFDGTDQTAALNTVLDAAIPGTTVRIYSATGTPMFIDGYVRITRNDVLLDLSQIAVTRGSHAEIGIRGEYSLTPTSNQFRLRTDAAPGDTVLAIDISPQGNMTALTVGRSGVLNGMRDASGNPLQRHEYIITARSTTGGSETITIDPPIPADQGTFKVTYPSGSYQVATGLTDRALLSVKVGMITAADVVAGTDEIQVATPSTYAVGDVCQLIDRFKSSDAGGTGSQLVRDELVRIRALGSGRVYTEKLIERSYPTSKSAGLWKVLPVTGSRIIAAAVDTLTQAPEASPQPKRDYYSIRFGTFCSIINIGIEEIAQTNCARGMAGRILHSMDSHISNSHRNGPPAALALAQSGDLYGFGIVSSSDCYLFNIHTERCRFGQVDVGSTRCTIMVGESSNDLIAGVVSFGLGSVGLTINEQRVTIGGIDFAPSTTFKMGIQLGHPDDAAGDKRITISDCTVKGPPGVANLYGVGIYAGCSDIHFQPGNRISTVDIGCYLLRSVWAPSLALDDVNLSGLIIEGVLSEPIHVDGSQVPWAAGTTFAGSSARPAYTENGGKVYSTINSGVAGATAPTHGSGSVSDGVLTWLFVAGSVYYPITRLRIESVEIQDCFRGIKLTRIATAQVTRCDIERQATPIVNVDGSFNPAIRVSQVTNLTIIDNDFRDYKGGVTLRTAPGTIVAENRSYNMASGVAWVADLGGNTTTTLEDNKTYGTTAGVDTSGGSTLTIIAPSVVSVLDDLTNVDVAAPSTNDVLVWDGTKWTNAAAGSGIADAPNDGSYYVRRNLAWTFAFSNLSSMFDTAISGTPTTGYVLSWNGTKWAPRAESVFTSQSMSQHTDWSSATPAEGNVPTWRGSDNKYHPEAPSASGGNDRVTLGTTVVGPVDHPFGTGDVGKLTYLDISAGDIHLQFDASVSHASTEALLASYLTVNYNPLSPKKVFFDVLSTNSTTPPVVQNSMESHKHTGTNNVQIPTGPTAATLTVTPGTDLSLFVVYFIDPANKSDVTLTSGLNLQIGAGASALQAWSDTAGNPSPILAGAYPRCCTYYRTLGTIAANTAIVMSPQWLDQASGLPTTTTGNVNAYQLFAFVFSGSDQVAPFTTPASLASNTAVSSVTRTVTSAVADCLCVHAITTLGNSGPTAFATPGGTTLLFELATGATLNNAELRSLAVSKAQVAAGVNSVAITLPATRTWAAASFAVRPSLVPSMSLLITDDKAENFGADNKLISCIYDANNTRVNISY